MKKDFKKAIEILQIEIQEIVKANESLSADPLEESARKNLMSQKKRFGIGG